MKYQTYPNYKPSGVEWLGDVPEHWGITRIKYVSRIFGRIGFRGYTIDDIVDPEDGAIVLSPSNIDIDRLSFANKVYLSWKKYYESPEIMVEAGDILLVKTGSTFGKSAIIKMVQEPMTINPQMALIKKSKVDSTFLSYLFNSPFFKANIEINNTGSGMPTMTQENINTFPVPLPTSIEAEKIANFLDHETAKIDTLIDKQQRLIALLKEKRQAVISHAVTKGLNPNAPMKPSGVEWLGDVPVGWVVCCIKHIVSPEKDSMVDGPFGSSVNTDEDYVDEGIPVIRTVNITNIGFSNENLKFMRVEKFNQLKRHAVYPNDVLFSKVGTIGNSCTLPKSVSEAILSTTGSCKITVNSNKYTAEFLVFVIQSMYENLMLIANSNVQPFLNMATIKNLQIPCPSLEEQLHILSVLNVKMKKIDSVISHANSAIELMQERRTALISAAVTGKIDVRDWGD